MSFSIEVKEELSKLTNLANKEAVKYELLGYLASNHISLEKTKNLKYILKFSTENEYNINRFGKLLSNLGLPNYKIEIIGKTFYITVQAPMLEEVEYKNNTFSLKLEKILCGENALDKLNMQNNVTNKMQEQHENLKKAFVRGTFLGSGSISNPKNNYHLQLTFKQKEYAQCILEILNSYSIIFKQLNKKQECSLYAKDGEEISKFLAFIGANKSVLKFEEIRVYRDIRNNVNRKVNCETANLNKIVNSALKQIEAIEYLQKIGEFENLKDALKEVANLRIMHPEASYEELGKMLKMPIGKSGVNHRLKAIELKAEELSKRKTPRSI